MHEFRRLLDALFAVADEKLFPEDRIGSLVLDEALDMCAACGYLLHPSAQMLAAALDGGIAGGAPRSWKLLAALNSFNQLQKVCVKSISSTKVVNVF